MNPVLFKVTIPGRAGILKNGKKLCRNRATGRMFLKSSDRYEAWEKKAYLHVKQQHVTNLAINFPVNMAAKFYFKDRQSEADLSNLYQGVEDVLQKAGVLADDRLIASHDGSGKFFGEEPRVEVEITAKG